MSRTKLFPQFIRTHLSLETFSKLFLFFYLYFISYTKHWTKIYNFFCPSNKATNTSFHHFFFFLSHHTPHPIHSCVFFFVHVQKEKHNKNESIEDSCLSICIYPIILSKLDQIIALLYLIEIVHKRHLIMYIPKNLLCQWLRGCYWII